MSDEVDTLAAALRAAGYDEIADQLEQREAAVGREPTRLADVLRLAGYADLTDWLKAETMIRSEEVDGGTLEASLADRAAAAFYRAGYAKPRA